VPRAGPSPSTRALDLNGRFEARADEWRQRVLAYKGASAWGVA
jgi:hypothetical protein